MGLLRNQEVKKIDGGVLGMKLRNQRFLTVLVVLSLSILACSLSGGPPGSPPEAAIITTTSTHIVPGELATFSPIPSTSTMTMTNSPTVEFQDTPAVIGPALTGTATATIVQEVSATLQVVQEELTSTPQPTLSQDAAPTAAPTPEPVNTDQYQQVLLDSFNGGGAWVSSAVEGRYKFGYTADAYQFTLEIPLIDVWSIRGKVYADSMQEVDIVEFQGASDGYAGLVCRWTRSTEYYRFTVSNAGEYRITKISGNVIDDLAQKTMSSINPSTENPVRLKAVCSGDSLVLYSNNQLILQAQDTDLEQGNFGLMAGSSGSGPISVKFDNYVLYAP